MSRARAAAAMLHAVERHGAVLSSQRYGVSEYNSAGVGTVYLLRNVPTDADVAMVLGGWTRRIDNRWSYNDRGESL